MKFISPTNWNIKRRVVFLAVAPLLVVVVFLTLYFSMTRIMDEQDKLLQQGEKYAKLVASSSEVYFFFGDIANLIKRGNSLLEEPEVAAVAYFDDAGEMIARVGSQPSMVKPIAQHGNDNLVAKSGNLWHFASPVYYTAFDNSDSEELFTETPPVDYSDSQELFPESAPAAPTPEVLGWVVVTIDEEASLVRRRQILIGSLSVALVVLIAALALAMKIGQSITSPINGMRMTIDEIREGNLNARVTGVAGGELGVMAEGINQLAAAAKIVRSALEQEVQNATKQLTLAMRELELHNEELEKARKDALNANKAKDIFLASMSHELRTPLTSIIGFINLQMETLQTEEQREYSEIIKQASGLMLAEIDDILELSRIESGVVGIEKSVFNLEAYLEGVIAMHIFSAYKKGLELVLFIESDVPLMLWSDPERIRQVVNILISNAIKFTDKGEVVLLVSVAEESEQEVKINFLVKDSGEGISKSSIDKLFQPFYQADSSVQKRHGGTGLGLYIAKSIVGLLGGELEISSEAGLGTEVNFSVVCEKQAQAELPPPLQESVPLLICEKNSWSRRAIRNQFLRYSEEIYACATHKQFMKLLERQSPGYRLVVLGLDSDDVVDKSLHQMLQEVRQRFAGPVIVLSPDPHLNALLPAAQVATFEPVYFLRKPLRREKLNECLQRAVAGKRPETDAVRAAANGNHTVSNEFLLGLKILVAEDNEFNRSLISKMLRHQGAETETAANGLVAKDACREDLFDLVLMDVQMPVMNGIEATREIRKGEGKNNHTPIIALTANVIENEKQDLFEAGIDEIVYKPIDEQEFYVSVCRCLGLEVPFEQRSKTQSPIIDPADEQQLQEQIRALHTQIRASAVDENWEVVCRQAHDFKGIAGMLVGGQVARLAVDINEAAIHKRKAEILVLLDALDAFL